MRKFFLPLLMVLFLLSGCASLPFGDPTYGVGNGTAWTSNSGYLVTNYHVVNPLLAAPEAMKANEIYISYKGTTQKAEIVDFDAVADLCLLKVEDNSRIPPALRMAEKPAKTGQAVHTVGFPAPMQFGTSPKYLGGHISAVLRHELGAASFSMGSGLCKLLQESGIYLNEGWPQSLIMTTAPAIQGVSGAPLLNEDGHVLGIMSGGLSSVEANKAGADILHCSFAIPLQPMYRLEDRTISAHGWKPVPIPLEESRIAPEDSVALVLTMTADPPENMRAEFRKLLDRIAKSYDPPVKK